MSGHNKWSKVKKEKQVKDKVKGNIFAKLARLIMLAVAEGGGITDPANNLRLRLVIEKAKAYNMPKENIVRAIEKATGPNKLLLKETLYEAFATGGIGLLIETSSDNHTRTFSEIKNVLERHGGKMGVSGSVAHLFQRCGLIKLAKATTSQDQLLSQVAKYEAEDIEETDEYYLVFIPINNIHVIKDVHPEVIFKPQSVVSVDEENMAKLEELINELENMDDVHKVYADY